MINFEAIKERKLDKSKWPDGIWKDEPDYLDGEFYGVPSRMIRNSELGHLCGYIGLSETHPDYGKDFDVLAEFYPCHYGLTFSSQMSDSDLWWIGFDCGHWGDHMPAMPVLYPLSSSIGERGVYRDMHYVTRQVQNLAQTANQRAMRVVDVE